MGDQSAPAGMSGPEATDDSADAAVPMLRIPCTGTAGASTFAAHLTAEQVDGVTIDGDAVTVPTDSPGFAWALAEIAVESGWAEDHATATAVSDFLEGPSGLVTLQRRRERERRAHGGFLIWSREHGWWAGGHHYTRELGQAMPFSQAAAAQVCEDANLAWSRFSLDGPPPEVMIPFTDDPEQASAAVQQALQAAIDARSESRLLAVNCPTTPNLQSGD